MASVPELPAELPETAQYTGNGAFQVYEYSYHAATIMLKLQCMGDYASADIKGFIITVCLLYSFCVVFFGAAVSAFALLSCSIVLFIAHFKLFY